MAQPYVGEIRIFAGNFAPAGWAFCDGALFSIDENETLYQLIGTTYGGDGNSTFAVPNLQARAPVHFGGGYAMADAGGIEAVTLTTSQIPAHTHALGVSTDTGSEVSANGNVLGALQAVKTFRPGTAATLLSATSVAGAGGSQPHENMQPYMTMNYIISLFGIFPSQT